MTAAPDAQPVLEREAAVFARYLVGRAPAPALVARYVAASAALRPAPADAADACVVAFARRHAWSVGPLDAAAALLRPHALLRTKLLVLAAILEASPEGADDFLPQSVPLPALVGRLAASGAALAARVLAGVVLWPLATRAGRA